MYVRKVRGQNKVGRIMVTAVEAEMVRKKGLTLEAYVKNYLRIIAKKRRWHWYLNKEKA